MSVSTQSSTNVFEVPPFPVRRFTVDEYHRMIQTGLLTEDDPVELLEGWIVPKMPRDPRHDATIELAQQALGERLPAGWRVRIQSAITTADSEPEPDLAVVRGPIRKHVSEHPGPEDIALVVEIAESSLTHDRTAKGRMYARSGIACYWIINLVDSQVEVFTGPFKGGMVAEYRQRQVFSANDSVPLIIDGEQVARIGANQLLAGYEA